MAGLVELLALVATVVGSAAALGYWLGRRLTRVEGKIDGMRRDFDRFVEGLALFLDAFLNFLSAKGLAEERELTGFKAFAEYLARPRSRYYTREVYERLVAILKKDVKDYTWEDVVELERIADLMFREAYETEDEEYARELFRSAWRVRIFKATLAGYLARRAQQSPSTAT